MPQHLVQKLFCLSDVSNKILSNGIFFEGQKLPYLLPKLLKSVIRGNPEQ